MYLLLAVPPFWPLSLSSATLQGALLRNEATERVVLKRVKTRVEVRSTHHRSPLGLRLS